MKKPSVSINEIREICIRRYDYKVNMQAIDNAADVLQGKFVSKDDELSLIHIWRKMVFREKFSPQII